MSPPKAKKPSCDCDFCRYLAARTYRELERRYLVEAGMAGTELEAELTNRWHAYAPLVNELRDVLPSHAWSQAHAARETQAITELLAWERSNMDVHNIAVLSGPHGTGKTVAAVYVTLFCMAGDSPVYVTAAKLARELRCKEARSEALTRCLEAQALIIDDLGKEQPSSYFARDLDEIIDNVYQSYRTLIVTTNLKGAEFRLRYGEGVADRIRERGRWIACTGKSMRGHR